MAYLLLYVEDMILSASTPALLQHIVARVKSTFTIKDKGPMNYFLGVQVTRTPGGFFLSQSKYGFDILDRVGMSNWPADTKPKASATKGNLLSDDN